MKQCKEIYPGIFRIVEQKKRRIAPPINCYIIAGSEGLIFDAGYGDSDSMRVMGEAIRYVQSLDCSWRITRVLPSHTHPDHFSGLKKLQQYYNLKIMLTEPMAKVLKNKRVYKNSYALNADLRYRYSTLYERISELPLQIILRSMYKKVYGIAFLDSYDIMVTPQEELSVNGYSFAIIPGPGHCDDHIMLYNKREGILFAGDNILRSIYTWLGPPRSDLEAYINTLETCLALPHLQIILSAHGSPITKPKERIQEIIEYRKKRTKQVYSIIANEKGGITFNKLLTTLYPRSLQRRWLAKGWIIVTIEYLVKKKALVFEGKKIKIAKDTHMGSWFLG